MSVHTTSCPRNCYSTCSMKVHVDGGRIRRIEAHPDNQATGEAVCLKGLSYVERQLSPDRILTPLRRRGDEFVPIGWDEALGEIADRLTRLRSQPQSVLYYAASGTKGLLNRVGMSFWRGFGGCTTTYGDLCWPAGLEATRLTLGANEHNAPWDLVNARLIVLWGKNAAETNIHQMPLIERAVAAGAQLVVIDPRRTQSAERADLLIRPRPGTDGALALGVAHVLVRDGLVDRDFVDAHVHGFAEFSAMLADYPPESVADVVEVPVEQIERLAVALGTVRPATISAGFGMQRYTNSGQTMRAMIALLALTGNLGKPGAGWQFANLQTAIFDAVRDPVAFYPPAEPDGMVRVSISTARLGADILATADPPLKLLWVERGNPVSQNPDTNRVLEAFRSVEFRVVVEQFMTDTAREADIVLPAKTLFEQTDVIGAYWHPYIQLKAKLVEPPGEVKPESEIYRELGERLGFSDAELAELPVGDAAVETWLERHLEPFPELSLERLAQGPVLVPGHREVAFADGFATASGKIELLSAEAAERWGVDPLPRFVESAESVRSASDYRLQLLTPNTKNRIHSQFNNLRMIRALSSVPTAQVHPDDARDRGIADGDSIRVFNDRGSFTVEARFDASIRRGCVAVTNGWWREDGGAVNFCSLGRETDLGHGAAFHDNLVEIERVSP